MQQINLYLDEFKRIEPKFSAAVILILSGYAFVIGVIITGVLVSMLWYQQSNLKQHQAKATEWEKQLAAAEQVYPEPKVDPLLLRKIDTLKENIARNQTVLRYLNGRQLEVENQAFSVLLLALTWVNQEDLWLTKVAIKDGGQSLSLTGKTLNPDSLPVYLDKLSELEVFSDMSFRVFDLTREPDGLSFEVSTKKEVKTVESLLEKVTDRN